MQVSTERGCVHPILDTSPLSHGESYRISETVLSGNLLSRFQLWKTPPILSLTSFAVLAIQYGFHEGTASLFGLHGYLQGCSVPEAREF